MTAESVGRWIKSQSSHNSDFDVYKTTIFMKNSDSVSVYDLVRDRSVNTEYVAFFRMWSSSVLLLAIRKKLLHIWRIHCIEIIHKKLKNSNTLIAANLRRLKKYKLIQRIQNRKELASFLWSLVRFRKFETTNGKWNRFKSI